MPSRTAMVDAAGCCCSSPRLVDRVVDGQRASVTGSDVEGPEAAVVGAGLRLTLTGAEDDSGLTNVDGVAEHLSAGSSSSCPGQLRLCPSIIRADIRAILCCLAVLRNCAFFMLH